MSCNKKARNIRAFLLRKQFH